MYKYILNKNKVHARPDKMFDHIEEAEQLYMEIPNEGVAPAPSSWHSVMGGRPGLLVDIGAAKPLTGSGFARSQISRMEHFGFHLVLAKLETPEFMRGVTPGSD